MITLVLGGARSGKSEVAERLVLDADAPTTYVATGAPPDPVADPDWAARVEQHRARRPPAWRTVEAGIDLAGVLAVVSPDHAVLVDSLGAWVASAPGFVVDAEGLCVALADRRQVGVPTVVVSDEVGLGVHPETAVGISFRDVLGDINRAVAAVADEVLLVVAGRVLRL